MIKLTIKKTAALIAVAHCQHLFAQTSLLEEVLVTAQKRSESVLDVPISMSAYSGNRLVEIGALDVKDIITRTPGLAGASKDSFIDFLSIRGISSNDFGVGGDPSVAIFQNGVFSGRSGEVLTGMYDIERVEVLRGPQGLLFGRSATAGAIHVVTSKADVESDISGDVGLGGGERDQLRGDFAVNIPINDALAIRFAGYHSEEDGYVTNIAGGEKLVSHDNDALRFSLAWQSDRASLDLVADYENRKQSPSIYSQLDATGRPITGDNQVVGTNVPKGGRDESEVYNLSLNATFDLTSMELVSITGFRTYDFDYREDPDGSTIDLLEYTQNQDGDYISQEFKLVSTTQDNLQWFIGVSGFRDKINADFAMASGEETLCELFVGLPCEDFIPGFVPNPNGMVEMGTTKGETWGASIYGDISYAFNEQWTAKAGLRASYDDKEYTITSAPVISELTDTIGRIGTLYAFQTDEPVKSSESWSYVNPRVVVEYTANESWMLYGSATNGTKPGAFDNFAVTDMVLLFPSPIAAPDADVGSVDEENVWSYEIGTKGQFFDDRATLSLSAYYYDYTDLQQRVFRDGVITVTENVGEADGKGIELEFTVRPSEYMQFRAAGAWQDTEIKKIDTETCATTTGSCEGNALPYSPEYTAFGDIRLSYPIADSTVFFITEMIYSDSFYSGLENVPLQEVDAWTEWNFRIGADIGEQISLTLFLENAFDEEHFDSSQDLTEDVGFAVAVGPARPRTWGVDVRYRF